MSLLTYYCGCEQLWISIGRFVLYLVTLLIGVKIGLYLSMKRYDMLNKLIKTKEFYHKQPCDCDICHNQKGILK